MAKSDERGPEGPLDTLDERALALTAASLLEEEVVVPQPQSAAEASPPSALITTPSQPDSVEPEAQATPASEAAPAPVELVESDRTLSPLTMLEFGALGGLISDGLGTIGDADPKLLARLDVRSTPTLIVFDRGEELGRTVGFRPAAWFDHMIETEFPARS